MLNPGSLQSAQPYYRPSLPQMLGQLPFQTSAPGALSQMASPTQAIASPGTGVQDSAPPEPQFNIAMPQIIKPMMAATTPQYDMQAIPTHGGWAAGIGAGLQNMAEGIHANRVASKANALAEAKNNQDYAVKQQEAAIRQQHLQNLVNTPGLLSDEQKSLLVNATPALQDDILKSLGTTLDKYSPKAISGGANIKSAETAADINTKHDLLPQTNDINQQTSAANSQGSEEGKNTGLVNTETDRNRMAVNSLIAAGNGEDAQKLNNLVFAGDMMKKQFGIDVWKSNPGAWPAEARNSYQKLTGITPEDGLTTANRLTDSQGKQFDTGIKGYEYQNKPTEIVLNNQGKSVGIQEAIISVKTNQAKLNDYSQETQAKMRKYEDDHQDTINKAYKTEQGKLDNDYWTNLAATTSAVKGGQSKWTKASYQHNFDYITGYMNRDPKFAANVRAAAKQTADGDVSKYIKQEMLGVTDPAAQIQEDTKK